MNNTIFINKIKPGAIEAYKKYGVLPSLTLAQACLESAFGNSAPGNMLFGIKWTEGCGYDKQLLWTHEYINGICTRVQAYFRKYNSMSDSIVDHAKLMTKTRYKPVITATNYIEACTQVQKCGYATDPAYTVKLISLIETYKLNQWDDITNVTNREEVRNMTVTEFQTLTGLAADGIAGDKTKAKAKEVLQCCQIILGHNYYTAEATINGCMNKPAIWLAMLKTVPYFGGFIMNIVNKMGGKA